MRPLLVVCALLAAFPASAGKRERMVVVSTGRLVVLGDRKEIGERLNRAAKICTEGQRKARRKYLEDLIENAHNRLDNAREFLGFEREEDDALAVSKEGREEDDRLADAVVSDRLVVTDLDTLWWELGRADFNLSRAAGDAEGRQDLVTLIEQARGEISVARELLTKMVSNTSPHPAEPSDEPRSSTWPPQINPPTVAVAVPTGPQAMSAGALAALLGAVERESWADDKMRVLETASRNQLFSVDQVVEIVGRFPFSHQKLKAVRILKDHLIDRQNDFQIYAAFTFEGDKEALKKILGGGELEARPIDSNSLEILLQQLKHGYSSQVGFQILREETPRRWFRIDQVSMVVSVFPTFEDRFRALGVIRPRILDPENWARLEPLFATMEDRARLRSLFASGR